MNATLYDLCVDAYPPGERYNPNDLPNLADPAKATAEELALEWRKHWQSGQELRIRFLDGNQHLCHQVQEYANAWLEHANLTFNFGRHAKAEIRITFTGRGYKSYVGTDALRADRSAPTMQLGGLDEHSSVLRRTVLHEFGHAIGCIHEQASPAADIPWDSDKVYSYYRSWQGWDDKTIYTNVLLRYSARDAVFSSFDSESIMQYPVPNYLTTGNFEIGWNDNLSAGDKSFIARIYPP